MENDDMSFEEIIDAPKKRNKLTQSIAAKTTAFILLIVFSFALALTTIGAVFMISTDFYRTSKESFVEETLMGLARTEVYHAANTLTVYGAEELDKRYEGQNISFAIYENTDDVLDLVYGKKLSESKAYSHTSNYHHLSLDDNSGQQIDKEYEITVYVSKAFEYQDMYSLLHTFALTAYSLRYSIYFIIIALLAVCIVLFVFLMCSSGHRRDSDGVTAGVFTKIPFDLLTGAVGMASFFILYLTIETSYSIDSLAIFILYGIAGSALLSMLVGWCMSFSTRLKLGGWWKNTIVYVVLSWLWNLLKKISHGLGYLFSNLPLIWKTLIFIAVLGILSFIVIMAYDTGARVVMWLFGMLLLFVLLGYGAISLRKLQSAGRKLAQGDLSCRVDTSRMFWDLKEHGENLNSIGLGMTRAVDERMKSERLKTELITNVSHDIKTPLTSIINYVDLISKEDCENEKVGEYIEVLSRQSERLKKLIEDLVEASKASTGNVEVNLSPCDVGVLLTQTAGEYESRLAEGSLELVLSKPEAPVIIMSDGRLLWRVFDNLMNNICKYSQPGTRVYMGLETLGDRAIISLKNTSKYPLNITAEELMERFVRGDSSRHTEGSGLGLSISRSLTQLQKGTLELSIDGDLFKVTLSFGIAR